jgi:hypothetical protein
VDLVICLFINLKWYLTSTIRGSAEETLEKLNGMNDRRNETEIK